MRTESDLITQRLNPVLFQLKQALEENEKKEELKEKKREKLPPSALGIGN